MRASAFRTPRAGPSVAGWRPMIFATILTFLMVPLIGAILFGIGLGIGGIGFAQGFAQGKGTAQGPVSELVAGLGETFAFLGAVLFFSPLLSWIGLLLGIGVGAYAAQKGYAGWANAALFGGGLAFLVALFVMPGVQNLLLQLSIGFAGVVAGLTFWAVIWSQYPAFIGLDQPSDDPGHSP